MSVTEVLVLIVRGAGSVVGVVYLARAIILWGAFVAARRPGRMRMLSMGLFMLTGLVAEITGLLSAAPPSLLTPLVATAMATGLIATCDASRTRRNERKETPMARLTALVPHEPTATGRNREEA